jgi:uncharacterized membrane protein YgaE (UPF0421/DUF939 family)
MLDSKGVAVKGGGYHYRSDRFSAQLFADGLASRGHQRLRAGMWRIRSNWWPILQTAMAASAAWYLANLVLGHEQPVVAAIAAVISLGATVDQKGRRAIEWVLGVAFGLAAADMVMLVIGAGLPQIGIVVALTMAAAVFVGAGKQLVGEAGVSALLVASLDPSTVGPTPDRFLEALLGVGVALAVHSLLPLDPKTMVEQAARPVFEDLTAALEEAAAALSAGDPVKAEEALRRAREIDARVAGLKEALGAGYEAARLSPSRRLTLGRLARYSEAADQIDFAVRNTRVLARAAVGLVWNGEPAPGLLSEAVLDLARAVDGLAEHLEEPEEPADGANRFALKAAEEATVVLKERNDLATSMLVGQVHSTAADLLRASGTNLEEAPGTLGVVVGNTSGQLDLLSAPQDAPA